MAAIPTLDKPDPKCGCFVDIQLLYLHSQHVVLMVPSLNGEKCTILLLKSHQETNSHSSGVLSSISFSS